MPKRKMALIALGSNFDPDMQSMVELLRRAQGRMAQGGFAIESRSRFYRTPCFPANAGPDYVNAAVCAWWSDTAEAALAALHGIEADFGRSRANRWGQRTLDLDLLALEDAIFPDSETVSSWIAAPMEVQATIAPDRLILPHPRMQDRAFVLVPLADVAPDWRHPITGSSVAQMLAARPATERAEIVAL